jgi:hypothetical protein
MRKLALVLVLALAISPGCSLMVGSRQPLTVTATDPRADLYVDGQYVGRGTGTTRVRRDEDHAVMARVGDRTGTASVGTRISGAGIADIVGCATFLLPCFGLLGPGFWRLDPSNVAVSVPPEAASSASAARE